MGRNSQRADVVPLQGLALSTDASQHSLFTFDGRLHFVTASSIGHIDAPQANTSSTMGGVSIQTATPASTAQAYYHDNDNVRKLRPAI